MTRFTYRPSWFERVAGRRPADLGAWLPRAALLAVGAAIAIVGTVFLVESRRLAALDDDAAALHARLAAAEVADASVERLATSVRGLAALRDAVIGARLDGAADVNAIARIGNRLPNQTWLTSIQTGTTGIWSIAGRSTGVDRVGSLLSALARLDPAATPRLVSISTAGHRGRVLDFTIALDRTP